MTDAVSRPPADASAHDLLNSMNLDRASPVPLYFQVAQVLEAAILDGRLAPGTRFENEVLLAEQIGLSRPTMRRAMSGAI